jgi:hypothetical protein
MYSYFDDYTEEEREQVRQRMVEYGYSWKDVINRWGHPSEWKEEQLRLL